MGDIPVKFKKKIKSEKGQSAVEFAFVLPIFLFLLFAIIDFGWYFYNYISMENSARNAARIACVEYSECAIATDTGLPDDKVYTLGGGLLGEYSTQEQNIVNTVKNTMPSSIHEVEITIDYTYDDTFAEKNKEFDSADRCNGDVIVTVKGKMTALTPVLSTIHGGKEIDMTSRSTFKVEQQYDDSSE